MDAPGDERQRVAAARVGYAVPLEHGPGSQPRADQNRQAAARRHGVDPRQQRPAGDVLHGAAQEAAARRGGVRRRSGERRPAVAQHFVLRHENDHVHRDGGLVFHAVFVTGTVKLRLVLRAPDPDDTPGINALDLRKMTPCADGVLRVSNAEAVSFQMLHFLLWWNYRHKRIDENNTTLELRVSWIRARQCLHYKEQCVGPQAAGLVGYALRETCRNILPHSVSVAIDPDYSILDYGGELADKARAELEIAQGCLGNDPDVLPALNEHCGHIKVVDELVDFVRNHPTKTTPPEPDATMPKLVSGNADDDDSEEEASQQLSQSKRIRSRSSSCFL